jgi:hypothetical protein
MFPSRPVAIVIHGRDADDARGWVSAMTTAHDCAEAEPACKLVVLTGGPGAGKTAVLEVVRRDFVPSNPTNTHRPNIIVLPEAAGIVFSGGFPRLSSDSGKRAAQRRIFHAQSELERVTFDDYRPDMALCDRGTLDGLAYWPGPPDQFFREVGTSREAELGRYAAVIHLRTPGLSNGYSHSNPLRIESAFEAAAIDERIALIWGGHPRYSVIDSTPEFLTKVLRAIEAIRLEFAHSLGHSAFCPSRHTSIAS